VVVRSKRERKSCRIGGMQAAIMMMNCSVLRGEGGGGVSEWWEGGGGKGGLVSGGKGEGGKGGGQTSSR